MTQPSQQKQQQDAPDFIKDGRNRNWWRCRMYELRPTDSTTPLNDEQNEAVQWVQVVTGYCAVIQESERKYYIVLKDEKKLLKESGSNNNGTEYQQEQDENIDSEQMARARSFSSALSLQTNASDGDQQSYELKHKITQDVYEKQQNSLIVFEYGDKEVALSFQNSQGCESILDQIYDVCLHVDALHGQLRQSPVQYSLNNGDHGNSQIIKQDFIQLLNMQLSYNELPVLENAVGVVNRQNSQLLCQNVDKILKIVTQLFTLVEDLKMKDMIENCFSIMKTIVNLNDVEVTAAICKSQDRFIKVLGIFEHDPEYPMAEHSLRRPLINSMNAFVNILQLDTQSQLLQKIHQTFRAQYLRDAVLSRLLDEGCFGSVNSFIMFNQSEILNELLADNHQQALISICRRFKQLSIKSGSDSEQIMAMIRFIHELFSTVGDITLINKEDFFRLMASQGIVQELCKYLRIPLFSRLVLDIIQVLQESDIKLLRQFVIAQQKYKVTNLLEDLIFLLNQRIILSDGALSDEELQISVAVDGARLQSFEVLFALLNVSTGDQNVESEQFLELFYMKYFEKLIAPLKVYINSQGTDKLRLRVQMRKLRLKDYQILSHLIQLITVLVQKHAVKSRTELFQHNVIIAISNLLYSSHSIVKLDVIKFIKAVIMLKDSFYNRHLIINEVLDKVMANYIDNKYRYNMLYSACLDLFNYIFSNRLMVFVTPLLARYKQEFIDLQYLIPSIGELAM
ncbi:hypothetical protein MP228_010969 [Amoeboaphelidium protococcarum]|nr:hypothetical protein MP228_010969 [Amoeboaphelidium protococcarum]